MFCNFRPHAHRHQHNWQEFHSWGEAFWLHRDCEDKDPGQGRNRTWPADFGLRWPAARAQPDALGLQHPRGVNPWPQPSRDRWLTIQLFISNQIWNMIFSRLSLASTIKPQITRIYNLKEICLKPVNFTYKMVAQWISWRKVPKTQLVHSEKNILKTRQSSRRSTGHLSTKSNSKYNIFDQLSSLKKLVYYS